MCGIAGFVERLDKEKALHQLKKMGNSILHRGPDSHGEFYDEDAGVGLSHRRLSILDLSPAGHQPMASNSGRYILTYNGEIYNFKVIRKILEQRGVSFKGHSDTEVLVNCIEELGLEESLNKICGMFAIALWDKKDNELTLIRDRSGQKPLYYSFNNGSVQFASELKALKLSPGWQGEVDSDNLALFMRHNYIPAPHSIYKNTFKLMPGTTLQIKINNSTGKACELDNFTPFKNVQGKLSPLMYWDLDEHIDGKRRTFTNPDDAVDELENILSEVVKEQMISDVPLGAFLSGGIDSSLVVAMMQKNSSQKVKTFSIGFEDDAYNEAHHAKDVAEHLGTDHNELYVTPKEAWEVVPKLSKFYDEPFADSSQIPTYLVSKMAKNHVTVSLSGDGGDELFGGYNRYFLATSIWDKVGQKLHGLSL